MTTHQRKEDILELLRAAARIVMSNKAGCCVALLDAFAEWEHKYTRSVAYADAYEVMQEHRPTYEEYLAFNSFGRRYVPRGNAPLGFWWNVAVRAQSIMEADSPDDDAWATSHAQCAEERCLFLLFLALSLEDEAT